MTKSVPRRRYVVVVALVGLVAGAVVLGLAVGDRGHRSHSAAQPHRPVTTPSGGRHSKVAAVPSSARTSTKAPPRAGAVHGSFSTVGGGGARLRIPALGVNAPIVATGAVNGSMVIPADVHQVGWYDGVDSPGGSGVSPAPGQAGVAILAGHVNWVGQGPGALKNIGALESGDRIDVTGTNGRITHWQVTGAPTVSSKKQLPPALFSNSGAARLALVTCGGPFDESTGNYEDNVIVWAALV
jgi:sortase (surface protein transpeptidase)